MENLATKIDIIGGILPTLVGILSVMMLVYSIFYIIFCPIHTDRALCSGRFNRLLLIATLVFSIPMAANFLLSLLGVTGAEFNGAITNSTQQHTPSLLWYIVYHFLNTGDVSTATSERAGMMMAIFEFLGAIFMGGVLVSAILAFFDQHISDWKEGNLRYNKLGLRNHIVILGGNDIVFGIISQLCKNKDFSKTYIVIQTSQSVQDLRNRLNSVFPSWVERNLVLYHGGRTNPDNLKDLLLNSARELYIIGENQDVIDEQDCHDPMNLQCLDSVAQILSDVRTDKSQRLPVHLLFESQTTYSVFQAADVSPIVNKNIELIPFNFYETWSNSVLEHGMAGKYKFMPLDGTGIQKDSTKHVHLVILGAGKMGMSMALETIHTAHYPNFREGVASTRTHITIIDPNAQKAMDTFRRQYSEYMAMVTQRYWDLSSPEPEWNDPIEESTSPYHYLWEHGKCNFLDTQIEFVQADFETPDTSNLLRDIALETDTMFTLAICVTNPQDVVSIGMFLPKEVYDNAQQILLYLRQYTALVDNLTSYSLFRTDNHRFRNIVPFGMVEDTCSSGITDFTYAKRINAFYCDIPLNNTDEVQKAWDSLSIALKWSNMYSAMAIPTKLRCIGLSTLATPTEIQQTLDDGESLTDLAIVEHNRWNAEKLLIGFRPLSKEEFQHLNSMDESERKKERRNLKNGVNRAHYCIVPTSMLDLPERLLDNKLIAAMPEFMI